MEKWYNPLFDTKQSFPKLKSETYDIARKVAPGYDVYFLEQEWQNFWYRNGRKRLKNPDGAFVGFCKRINKENPNP